MTYSKRWRRYMRTLDSAQLGRIAQKWMPVVEGQFRDIKNQIVLRYICYYCEWVTSDVQGQSELPRMLAEMKIRLSSGTRLGIQGKYYNPIKGIFEYLLENGEYVPMDHTFEYKLSDEEMIEMFGLEFLSKVDRRWSRDYLIGSILGDGGDN
jgi:hypothetical protein